MKKLIRSSLSSLLFYGARCFPVKGVRILTYHRVNDGLQDYLSVSVNNFKEQMAFLYEAGYQTAGFSDLLNGRVNDKSIMITFDDGYQDNFEFAYPILKTFGFKACIFLIAQKIETPDFLTKKQIAEMAKAGFEFGSHTLSHVHLPKTGSEQKWREIHDSKTLLEETLNLPIASFCYPYGEHDAESVNMLQKAGYQAACANIPGSNREIRNPLLLKRTEISAGDSLYDFEKKLAGAYDLLHQGLHWMRGRP